MIVFELPSLLNVCLELFKKKKVCLDGVIKNFIVNMLGHFYKFEKFWIKFLFLKIGTYLQFLKI
jgi:hypothetical protein